MFNWILRNVIGKIVARSVRRRLNAFHEDTLRPQQLQESLWRKFVTRNVGTSFGRDHGFHDIRTLSDFRRHLPISPYEYFEPYIARMRKGDINALLADDKIHMFALTSGTTATRKFIPVNESYLANYRRGWQIWGIKVFRDHPEVRMRPIVQMSGDWQEFTTEAGIPCGTVTGLTATMQMRIIRYLYCVPPCVGRIKDPATKYYLALRLSLPRRVALMIAANPSTMVNLARAGDLEKETLIRDLYDGTLDDRFDVPKDIRNELARKIRKKHQSRAKDLEEIVRRTGTLYPKDYWPHECVIGNWMGGSVGAYLRHFPQYFGDKPVRDVGLIASEGRMTIPLWDDTPNGVLDVTSHFFEFIPEAEGDSDNPTVLSAWEIEAGKTYYILLTTDYGLYRYNIHDVVRVTGFYNKTPIIEFMSKGAHFANITGEKISEYHVAGAMKDVLEELDTTVSNYSLAPCWDDEQPYYGLFIERGDFHEADAGIRLAQRIERRLREVNVEYAAKRESQRLGPIRLQLLANGAWQKWDRQRLAKTGGTFEQYKHPCLIADLEFRNTISVVQEVKIPDEKPPLAG